MFWNKLPPLLRPSLKSKLALSFALLFILLCLSIFFFMHWYMSASLNSVRDNDCRQIARRLKHFYVLGSRVEKLPEMLASHEVPDEVRQKAAASFPDCRMLFGYRTRTDDGEHKNNNYAICIYHVNTFYDCLILDDGELYSRELKVENNLPRLKRYISQLLRERGTQNIKVAIVDANHKEFVSSAHRKNKQTYWEAFPPTEDLHPMEFNGYRYQTISLPDGKRILAGWNAEQRDNSMRTYKRIALIAMVCAAFAGSLLAWLLTRRFIGGIKRTTLAMTRIAKGDYSYRIHHTDNDPEIRQLMETFNDMNSRTEKLLLDIKLMSDNVAHDLRTPLTRISGTVELLLRDRNLAEPVRSVCVSVAEETNRLKDMVNTLMDISRTSRGPDELDTEVVNLAELLRDFCDFLLPAFEDKELVLLLQIPQHPVMIKADKGKLQRLLSNLLENALKFTANGSVTAAITTTSTEVLLSIKDSGCGIDAKDLPRIFERFYRCDSSRHYQGNGLGLALVKAICDAHKWQIEVNSTAGKGTEFIITIPANNS